MKYLTSQLDYLSGYATPPHFGALPKYLLHLTSLILLYLPIYYTLPPHAYTIPPHSGAPPRYHPPTSPPGYLL
jgi:hypothetical protein